LTATVAASAQKAAPESAYEKALAYFEQRTMTRASPRFGPAIKDAEGKPELRVLVAHCHAGKKNYADAVAHLRIVAEENEARIDVREDIVALLLAQGKYREARKVRLSLCRGHQRRRQTCTRCAHAQCRTRRTRLWQTFSGAQPCTREAKQSDNADIKYGGLITETRALIALGNLAEADIALSYAESMRDADVHAMLRANIAELQWAQQKFPEDKRADVVAAYEKLGRSENPEIKTAATRNLERVKAMKAP
jgi:tetratricopeptide (TPR) repeat protein